MIDVTALARGAIDLIDAIGPPVVIAGGVALVFAIVRPAGRASLVLASRGLTGEPRPWVRRAVSGVAIPLLSVTAISVALGLEREIRQGPNRMLEQLVGPWEGHATWLLERGTSHLMNTSALSGFGPRLSRRVHGMETLWSQLTDVVVPGRGRVTSIAFAQAGSQRSLVGPGQAVVDSDLLPVGAELEVLGKPLSVVGHFRTPASLLNRAVVLVDPSVFESGGAPTPPYAEVATTRAAGAALRRLAQQPAVRDHVELSSTAAIAGANQRFWAGSATPIMMILILLILAFGTVAYYAARRAAQAQARTTLTSLIAIGINPGTLVQAEIARAGLSTLIAGAVAAPLAVGVVATADSQILGFHATVAPTMVLSAMGLTVLVGCLTAFLLYPSLLRVDPRAATVS